MELCHSYWWPSALPPNLLNHWLPSVIEWILTTSVWPGDNLLKFNDRKSNTPEESNPPSPLHLSRLNNHVFMERLHCYKYLRVWLTSILSWSMQVSKLKYAKKQDNKWVFCTERSIPLQTLHHSDSCTYSLHPYVHIWSMEHLYGTPTNRNLYQLPGESAEVCTEAVHQKLESVFQSCNLPTVASRRLYMKLCLLYQIVNGHPNFPTAPIVPWNLSRSPRNTSTLALEWPVTRMNASFFPHTITLWNSLPPHVYKTSRHCVPLNKLYFVTH